MSICTKCGTNLIGTTANPPADQLCHYCERDQLRTQLAEQSAKMASLEAEAGVMREALRPFADAFTKIIKRGGERRREWNEDMPAHFPITLAVTMADGRSAQAALSTQAGNALLKRVQALEAVLGRCRDMAGIYMDCAGHHSDGDDPCPKCELAKAITAALSTQAGIDPLKRMADLEGDKRRLDWLELQQVGCVPCWKDDERGELRHAGWITVAEEHQDRTFGIELVRSSVRDAIDAALSQEQATTRNV